MLDRRGPLDSKKDYLSTRCLGIAHNDPTSEVLHKNAMLVMLSDALYAADLRWMWCGSADACEQREWYQTDDLAMFRERELLIRKPQHNF